MLEFQQIKNQYPEQLQVFERSIIREYLQFKILQGIFESKLAHKLSFLGGTALRIVYGNDRFSEDIDLDQFDLEWVEFEDLSHKLMTFLRYEGFDAEFIIVDKEAFHCYIRFPKILFDHGISPIREEKILIRLDSTSQGVDYEPENIILNKFDVFTQIKVTPMDTLLSMKIYAAANRKRPKGRDFYDITFLLGRTKPDYKFLTKKMGVDSPEKLRGVLLEKIETMDFLALADDVAPFLFSVNEKKRVEKFKIYWQQAALA